VIHSLPYRDDRPGRHSRCFPVLILSAFSCFTLTPAARAQKADPLFSTVPFDQWVAQGDHVDIPWKTKIYRALLDDE
jgi:hypothetical protein